MKIEKIQFKSKRIETSFIDNNNNSNNKITHTHTDTQIHSITHTIIYFTSMPNIINEKSVF